MAETLPMPTGEMPAASQIREMPSVASRQSTASVWTDLHDVSMTSAYRLSRAERAELLAADELSCASVSRAMKDKRRAVFVSHGFGSVQP